MSFCFVLLRAEFSAPLLNFIWRTWLQPCRHLQRFAGAPSWPASQGFDMPSCHLSQAFSACSMGVCAVRGLSFEFLLLLCHSLASCFVGFAFAIWSRHARNRSAVWKWGIFWSQLNRDNDDQPMDSEVPDFQNPSATHRWLICAITSQNILDTPQENPLEICIGSIIYTWIGRLYWGCV